MRTITSLAPAMLATTLVMALAMALAAGGARAAVVTYSFTGHVTAEDTTGPLRTLLNPNFDTNLDVVTGAVTFDASTAPTSPGVFDLPSATIVAHYAGGDVTATGAVATVTVNQDGLGFSFDVPASEFLPTVVGDVTIGLGFQTFTDGYFSLANLPTTVPPNDKDLGFSYHDASGAAHGASTDTNIVVTASVAPVPAPPGLAVLGMGLAGLGWARRPAVVRGSRQAA